MKKLAFTIDLIIFPFEIRFFFAESNPGVKRYLDRAKVDYSDYEDVIFADHNECEGMAAVFKGSNIGIVRMRGIPRTAFQWAALQHEITHIVMLILYQALETPHNIDTTEVYAYVTDYITEQVYSKIFACRK